MEVVQNNRGHTNIGVLRVFTARGLAARASAIEMLKT